MTRYEYFHVFEAIIYGLALTEILTGVNKMIQARKTIKVYWAHILFVFIYITILLNHYCWLFFRNPFDIVDSTFTFMLFVAIFPISFLLGAYQGFPKDFDNVDFKEFFNSKRKEILIPILIMQIATLFNASVTHISIEGDANFLQHITSAESLVGIWLIALFIPLIAIATFHKKLWPSEVLAVVGLAAQTYFNFHRFPDTL
jgi:hypothetical protein